MSTNPQLFFKQYEKQCVAIMFDNFSAGSGLDPTTVYKAFNNGAPAVDEYSSSYYAISIPPLPTVRFGAQDMQTVIKVELIVTGAFDGQVWVSDLMSPIAQSKGYTTEDWEPNVKLSDLSSNFTTLFNGGPGQADTSIESYISSQVSSIFITGATVIEGVSIILTSDSNNLSSNIL